MKDKLFNLFGTTGDLSFESIVFNILMAAVLGTFIFISYMLTHRGTIYSKKFNASLLVLTVLTGTVMTVIGNNIALSLGMVGALSIVRFRTAIKDSRDTVYIFWTVIVGICCGVGDYVVASVGSAITFIILLLLGLIKSDNRMLVIIRASRSRQSTIQAHMFSVFKRKAILRVRNTDEDSVEFIYEITANQLKHAEDNNGSIVDALYNLGGVEYVNVVMQNDEVSN
ncbi:MAG: DUF4956 domain-containing protein [Ruminococcus sp.]|jgi:uncharacterized membrane protein YhiD involved in acid resistance|nr:DUF4956 domain-containing protein [Ruminococcus sp.]